MPLHEERSALINAASLVEHALTAARAARVLSSELRTQARAIDAQLGSDNATQSALVISAKLLNAAEDALAFAHAMNGTQPRSSTVSTEKSVG